MRKMCFDVFYYESTYDTNMLQKRKQNFSNMRSLSSVRAHLFSVFQNRGVHVADVMHMHKRLEYVWGGAETSALKYCGLSGCDSV